MHPLCYGILLVIMWAKKSGFTIVELLIVIVVIAILAAITIAAYSGMQNRAKDSSADAGISQIKKAMELYKVDNDAYPAVCTADNSGCSADLLAAPLAAYLPTFPSSYSIYQYVRGSATSYAIYVRYYVKASCKTGVNVVVGWWGSSLPVC